MQFPRIRTTNTERDTHGAYSPRNMAGKRGYSSISTYVNKRVAGGSYNAPLKRRRTSSVKTVQVVPGFTRRVGNYGRYGGNAVRAGMMPEKKFFDTALSFSVDATGEVPVTGQLTLIPQGDTESTRDGRKAVIESIQIRGSMLFTPGASATAATATNLWLVLDTQCNGAAAAWDDVFSGTAVTGASTLLNLNNSGRFRILKHWSHTWNPAAGATAAYNQSVKTLEYFKRCSIPVDWSSTTGAITEIRSNNIFLLAGATNTDDQVAFTGNARLRFRG